MKVTAGNHYLAFVLSKESRNQLLAIYPKRWVKIVCHHVTFKYVIEESEVEQLQQIVNTVSMIQLDGFFGGNGIDAFRVSVDGRNTRIDAKTYHLTFSRAEERSSSDSLRLFTGEIPFTCKFPAEIMLDGHFELITI